MSGDDTPVANAPAVTSPTPPRVFGLGEDERDALVAHFRDLGWVAVDAIDSPTAVSLASWVDEIAALADGTDGVLQHFERTDAGTMLARSENFVPIHAGLRSLLCEGAFVDVAGALLDAPAVLYKEKVNYKLAGGAGYSPHQDAPAYPMIDVHVSAMVAVDDADEGNGCLEVVSAHFAEVLPLDERGCIDRAVVERLDWQPLPLAAGQTLWFHSRTPHRSTANRSPHPRRALYPTYNAASEGDLREAYYAAKRAAFRSAEPVGDRARVSLIGDFEGRPV
ncbi:MAG: phytanoyl-CoA dioxygenase family protein [Acidimicrobiia bacterium]